MTYTNDPYSYLNNSPQLFQNLQIYNCDTDESLRKV